MENDRIHVAPGVRASISNDGLVLLDLNGGLVFAANMVGARIWQLIEECCPRSEIVHRLADEYQIPTDRAHSDLNHFVETLAARGLIAMESRC
jgi:hypothetical protein